MPIVTLLTDSGQRDHYVAAIRAKIFSVNPGLRVVDITHQIVTCDIGHAAYVLRSVFRDFPKGTVHLTGVDAVGNRGGGFLAMQLEDHFFVGADNGVLSLISEKPPQQVVELNTIAPVVSTFPEKEILAPAAAKLASGVALTDLGRPMTNWVRMTDRQVKATKKNILGHVIRVDHYGNLITNIQKDVFDLLSKGKVYTIQFGGEKLKRILANYNMTDQGECFVLFNSQGLLEVGIYKGNAAELLGLSVDSPVNVIFEE
ncbi:MAG: SAM-dependent chlorinase/fluorinase [Cyclobacteriaceae bacterium]|nr:SAM-dependent chlorinase/fluorinase [Cyclobacteriaceae bacterium]